MAFERGAMNELPVAERIKVDFLILGERKKTGVVRVTA